MSQAIGYNESCTPPANWSLGDTPVAPVEQGGPYIWDVSKTGESLLDLKLWVLPQNGDFDHWRDLWRSDHKSAMTNTTDADVADAKGDLKNTSGTFGTQMWGAVTVRTFKQDATPHKIVVAVFQVSTINEADAITRAKARREEIEAAGVLTYG